MFQEARLRVVEEAQSSLDTGELEWMLGRRVAHRTQSQLPGNGALQRAYFAEEIIPALATMGFESTVLANVVSPDHPVLVSRRTEDASLPTVLLYGHADVQFAHEASWGEGLHPWEMRRVGERIYGRGTADNKGQHTVNLLALRAVLDARGALGYNVTVLIESGEEAGSAGLDETVREHLDLLRADLFIGSDGPRYTAETPTVFLGSRGCAGFTLECDLRADDAHSGNWGGRLRNPATTIAAAIAELVDGHGVIRVPELLPSGGIPDAVREAIAALPETSAAADAGWGQPGLSPAERVLGWNTLEVIAMGSGDPDEPVNAIPGRAVAHLHLRYVSGTDTSTMIGAIRAALDAAGLGEVRVRPGADVPASRLDPDHPVVRAAVGSIRRTTGFEVAVMPNLGGTIPNAVFADTLGLPTLWIPHSYPGSRQHAPDEHALVPLLREGLAIMAGVFWDMADDPAAWFPSGR